MPIIRAPSLLDGADPINKGLQGFWPLNEPSVGVIRDISPYRANGVTINSPTRVFGSLGRATKFNGSNQYATITRTIPTPGLSLSMWINQDTGAAGNNCMVSTPFADGNNLLWQCGAGTNFAFWSNTAVGGVTSPAFSDIRGKWVLAGVSCTSLGVIRFYLNGVYIGGGTDASGAMFSSMSGLVLGRWDFASARNFQGTMALGRTWSRVLRDGEFLRLYCERWAGTRRLPRRVASAATAVSWSSSAVWM